MALYALDEAAEFLQHRARARDDGRRTRRRARRPRARRGAFRAVGGRRAFVRCDTRNVELLGGSGARAADRAASPAGSRATRTGRAGHGERSAERCSQSPTAWATARTSCRRVRCSCRRSHAPARWTRRSGSRKVRWPSPSRVGDEALAGEAMHRLAITLLASRSEDAVELLLRLIARARAWRTAPWKRARTVARCRTHAYARRPRWCGCVPFGAGASARDAQALDVAASSSMNLGVIGLRGGDFASAHDALTDALRLYTTLRNNSNRLARCTTWRTSRVSAATDGGDVAVSRDDHAGQSAWRHRHHDRRVRW